MRKLLVLLASVGLLVMLLVTAAPAFADSPEQIDVRAGLGSATVLKVPPQGENGQGKARCQGSAGYRISDRSRSFKS